MYFHVEFSTQAHRDANRLVGLHRPEVSADTIACLRGVRSRLRLDPHLAGFPNPLSGTARLVDVCGFRAFYTLGPASRTVLVNGLLRLDGVTHWQIDFHPGLEADVAMLLHNAPPGDRGEIRSCLRLMVAMCRRNHELPGDLLPGSAERFFALGPLALRLCVHQVQGIVEIVQATVNPHWEA